MIGNWDTLFPLIATKSFLYHVNKRDRDMEIEIWRNGYGDRYGEIDVEMEI